MFLNELKLDGTAFKVNDQGMSHVSGFVKIFFSFFVILCISPSRQPLKQADALSRSLKSLN